MLSRATLLLAAGLLPAVVLARTDLVGCTSSETVVNGGGSLVWYVPDTGELCEFIDCGGGRAPPITTRPGCYGYTGTATVTPSFLPGFAAGGGGSGSAIASETFSAPIRASSTGTTTAPPESATAPSTSTTTDINLSEPGIIAISGKDGTTTTIRGPAPSSNGTNTSEQPGIIVSNGSTRTVFGTNKPPSKTSSGGAAVSTGGAMAVNGAGGLLGAAAAMGVAAML